MRPNLIIIGAMKSATTSLHYYLSLHPQILMSREKELDFFIAERNWGRGVEWYESHFTGDALVYGESSPNYTNYPRFGGVPERAHSIIPDAKLIYLLRDPVERILSHWVHAYASGLENRGITEALKEPDNRYVNRSRYFMQLEQFLKYFQKSRILIITTEDLYKSRQESLRTVFRFLGVDESFDSPKFSAFRQQSGYKRRKGRAGLLLSNVIGTAKAGPIGHLPPEIRGKVDKLVYLPFSRRVERPVLNPALRAEVIDSLREDVERLKEHSGMTFDGWCL